MFSKPIAKERSSKSTHLMLRMSSCEPSFDTQSSLLQNHMHLHGTLIPGLPNDIAQLCLARVQRAALPRLRCVSSSWKRLCDSDDFLLLRRQVGSAEGWIYVLAEQPRGAHFKKFNPQANIWYKLPSIPDSSEHVSWLGFACVAVGSTLLLIGGIHETFDPVTQRSSLGVVSGEVKVYSACTNQWSTAASMITPRSWFAAATIGDYVFVAGGQGRTCFLDSAEVYDSKQDVWIAIPSMLCVRSSCSGVALDGQFWVVGGENMRNQYGDKPKRSSAEVYDPKSGTWRLISEMWLDSNKVAGPNTVYNGKLLFVHQNKLMLYETETNGWNHVGNLPGGDFNRHPLPRFGFACESLDDELFIIGGRRESWHDRFFMHRLNTTEVCSLRSEGKSRFLMWKNLADMGDTEGVILASAVLML